MPFDHRYCWILTFSNEVVTKVRAYLNSAIVTQLFRENPAYRMRRNIGPALRADLHGRYFILSKCAVHLEKMREAKRY